MKARILLLAAGIATLTSCSSLYKTGQTPDDVYYSPARPAVATGDEYVQNENANGYQSYQQYQDAYRDNRFLRMSIANPYYMSAYNTYDGFDWRYNAYCYYDNSPWTSYWAWNNYYNPYGGYCVVPIGGYSKSSYIAPVSKPVAFNGSSYRSNVGGPRYISGSNGAYYNQGSPPRYNNSNSYSPASSNNSNSSSHNNNTYTPTRSYSPGPGSSSGSSSSGGGGGGGGGSVSRPTRH